MVDLSTALLVTCPAGVQQHEGVGASADRGQRVQKRSPGEPGEKWTGPRIQASKNIYIYTYIYLKDPKGITKNIEWIKHQGSRA